MHTGDHLIPRRVLIVVPISKLDKVGPFIAYPVPANSTPMQIRLVRQDRNLCFDWNSLFELFAKTAVTFESVIQF